MKKTVNLGWISLLVALMVVVSQGYALQGNWQLINNRDIKLEPAIDIEFQFVQSIGPNLTITRTLLVHACYDLNYTYQVKENSLYLSFQGILGIPRKCMGGEISTIRSKIDTVFYFVINGTTLSLYDPTGFAPFVFTNNDAGVGPALNGGWQTLTVNQDSQFQNIYLNGSHAFLCNGSGIAIYNVTSRSQIIFTIIRSLGCTREQIAVLSALDSTIFYRTLNSNYLYLYDYRLNNILYAYYTSYVPYQQDLRALLDKLNAPNKLNAPPNQNSSNPNGQGASNRSESQPVQQNASANASAVPPAAPPTSIGSQNSQTSQAPNKPVNPNANSSTNSTSPPAPTSSPAVPATPIPIPLLTTPPTPSVLNPTAQTPANNGQSTPPSATTLPPPPPNNPSPPSPSTAPPRSSPPISTPASAPSSPASPPSPPPTPPAPSTSTSSAPTSNTPPSNTTNTTQTSPNSNTTSPNSTSTPSSQANSSISATTPPPPAKLASTADLVAVSTRLLDGKWYISSIGSQGGSGFKSYYFIVNSSAKRFIMYGGCNVQFYIYTLTGSQLSFGTPTGTAKVCTPNHDPSVTDPIFKKSLYLQATATSLTFYDAQLGVTAVLVNSSPS